MTKIQKNYAPEVCGCLATTFTALMLIILYLHLKLQDCNDYNHLRKNVTTYLNCKPNDSLTLIQMTP
jgi:hypothetical protein